VQKSGSDGFTSGVARRIYTVVSLSTNQKQNIVYKNGPVLGHETLAK